MMPVGIWVSLIGQIYYSAQDKGIGSERSEQDSGEEAPMLLRFRFDVVSDALRSLEVARCIWVLVLLGTGLGMLIHDQGSLMHNSLAYSVCYI
jgi:hypothetical protein